MILSLIKRIKCMFELLTLLSAAGFLTVLQGIVSASLEKNRVPLWFYPVLCRTKHARAERNLSRGWPEPRGSSGKAQLLSSHLKPNKSSDSTFLNGHAHRYLLDDSGPIVATMIFIQCLATKKKSEITDKWNITHKCNEIINKPLNTTHTQYFLHLNVRCLIMLVVGWKTSKAIAAFRSA